MSSQPEDENKAEAQSLADFVQPEELEYFIQSLREFRMEEIGSKKWLDCHEIVIKLSQQAVFEANSYREESVKEFLIIHQKLKVLVHEVILIFLWKTKVLPKLLEIDPNPPTSFLLYSVLFHEGAAISLLEVVLYHQHGCESLDETALDLTDYCAVALSQLIGLISMGHHEKPTKINVDESILSELERQKRDLLYKIGLRCVSIMNYLVDKLDALPLSVGRRMVTIHDIPCLLSDLLHLRPWLRKTDKGFEKYENENWKLVDGENLLKVTKYEAQTWFCLRQLLFNQALMESYEINDFRQRQLSKCQGILNETILDQLPPLGELKHFLCTLRISKDTSNTSKHRQNLILEEVPQIKENILKKVEKFGGFKKIAAEQAEKIFITKRDEIFQLAKRLNSAYNTDLLAEMEEKLPDKESQINDEGKCQNCKKDSNKKCANCLTVFYCSRECQVEHWPTHKSICLTQQKVPIK